MRSEVERKESLRAVAENNRQRALTLLETLLAFVILTMVLGGAVTLATRTERHLSDELRRLSVDDAGTRLLRRLSTELTQAYPSSVLPALLDDSDYVTFQKVTGYSGGAVQFCHLLEHRCARGHDHWLGLQPGAAFADVARRRDITSAEVRMCGSACPAALPERVAAPAGGKLR